MPVLSMPTFVGRKWCLLDGRLAKKVRRDRVAGIDSVRQACTEPRPRGSRHSSNRPLT